MGVTTLMDEKTIFEAVKNAAPVLMKGDRVELIPGPNGTVKIIHIKRKIVKTVQGKDCTKC